MWHLHFKMRMRITPAVHSGCKINKRFNYIYRQTTFAETHKGKELEFLFLFSFVCVCVCGISVRVSTTMWYEYYFLRKLNKIALHSTWIHSINHEPPLQNSIGLVRLRNRTDCPSRRVITVNFIFFQSGRTSYSAKKDNSSYTQ